MKRLALIAMTGLVLAGCGGSSGTNATQLSGVVLTPSLPAPNFTLEDQAGHMISLAQQRGHWSVVTFLYTKCPDVCPIIAANLNGALKTAAGKKAGLTVLAVSVDPARDTLPAVRKYAVEHQLVPAFHYLIGSRAQLAPVWQAYHEEPRPGPKGSISHSSFEMLIDPQGKERLIYDAAITTAELSGDLAKLEV